MGQEFYPKLEQKFDKHIVIPDLHGESKLLEQVIDKYNDDNTGFVFLGDVIDQKGVAEADNNSRLVLNHIQELGHFAILNMANHEFVMQGAFFARDREVRENYSDYWNMISQNSFQAYGLEPTIRNDHEALSILKLYMEDEGHIEILRKTSMYYETEKFIASHAGLDPIQSWEEQRSELDTLAVDLRKDNFPDYGGEKPLPSQIFSIQNAMGIDKVQGTDKITLSGHAHYLIPSPNRIGKLKADFSPERVLHDGKKIRLASQLNQPANQNLHIWKDWDEEIDVFINPVKLNRSNEIETV